MRAVWWLVCGVWCVEHGADNGADTRSAAQCARDTQNSAIHAPLCATTRETEEQTKWNGSGRGRPRTMQRMPAIGIVRAKSDASEPVRAARGPNDVRRARTLLFRSDERSQSAPYWVTAFNHRRCNRDRANDARSTPQRLGSGSGYRARRNQYTFDSARSVNWEPINHSTHTAVRRHTEPCCARIIPRYNTYILNKDPSLDPDHPTKNANLFSAIGTYVRLIYMSEIQSHESPVKIVSVGNSEDHPQQKLAHLFLQLSRYTYLLWFLSV